MTLPAIALEPVVVALIQMALAAVALVGWWGKFGGSTDQESPGKSACLPLLASARLLLLATVALAVGSALRALLGARSSPGAADVFLLLAYPLLFAAALKLPGSEGKSSSGSRTLVDGLMIMSAAATFSWYFVLGPALAVHRTALLAAAFSVAYPVLDLVLVAALLVVSARSSRLTERRWAPIVVGIGAIVLADSFRQNGIMIRGLGDDPLADIIRLLGTGLLVTAAITFVRARHNVTTSDAAGAGGTGWSGLANPQASVETAHVWDSLLPYALVPATAGLAINAWDNNLHPVVLNGVVVGTILLVTLAFFRQVLAIKESFRLYGKLDQTYRQSLTDALHMRSLNEELAKTRDELQRNYETLAGRSLKLSAQATTDPLTGLPNHRSMIGALDQELDRAQRYSRPCSVLFLDLDHFKALNDSCGHLAGDSILREIAGGPMVEGLRAADVAGRWGGEEFVIVLPETETGDALVTAKRIRAAVCSYPFSLGGGARLTCSIGVATYPYDAANRDDLIESADSAMYAAKRLGRNQVRAAVDPSVIGFASEVRKWGSREDISLWGMVEALRTIVRVHDPATDEHADEVADLAMQVARNLGLGDAEVRTISLAARLHDIGKVSIPLPILSKPSSLDAGEWSLVKPHPAIGADVVRRVPALSMLAPLIRSHHERWDGAGYPDGLTQEAIPVGARIISACDAFTAMISHREYKAARTADDALQEMRSCAETQFDPEVVAALHQVLIDSVSLAHAKAG